MTSQTEMNHSLVDGVPALMQKLSEVRRAQEIFASYSQEQVDRIFRAAALAANHARLPLAKMAVEETGMGVVEDKVIKNNYASEYIYNAYKHTKTCGVIEKDPAYGTMRIAEPIGVVAAVIPTTNPTSTAIFKSLICLKTRNAILISPHPRAKKITIAAAKIVLEAAVKAGAPENIIGWIDVPSLEMTNTLMQEADIILATGGPGMVRAAYSSGKPALGVGAGNTPAVIDASADIEIAVNSIVHSKTFDNGMICASEQSVIVDDSIVRGTTSRRIVKMLRQSGAKEIHMRIASPAITHPCFYGVDMSTYDELICAREKDLEAVRRLIGADSLVWLSPEALYKAAGGRKELCIACFNGRYPTALYQSIHDVNKDKKC